MAIPDISTFVLAGSTLLGAIVGGFAAYLATNNALSKQLKLHRKDRTEMAVRFFKFYFKEQSYHIACIKNYRATNSDIKYLNLDTLVSNFNMFERNKEHIIAIEDDNLRSYIFDMAHEIQVWANIVTNNAPRSLNDATDDEKQIAKDNMNSIFEKFPQFELKLNDLNIQLNNLNKKSDE